MTHTITLIPGDGIGPEVTEAVVRILKASGVAIDWESHVAGIAVAMLAIAVAAAFIAPRDASNLLMTINIGLGFILLIWYVRE